MPQIDDYSTVLLGWFLRSGGTLDTSVMGFHDFEGHGRGTVALQDIPQGHTLFTIPRSLTLSTRTSRLPALLGSTWKQYQLHRGWAGVILCMLWEESQGLHSKWSGYMATMPDKFDTPMFWSPEDIVELQGTAVVDKIGRDEAEKDYYNKLIPALKDNPSLFAPNDFETHYSLEKYHIMGSRILSRSFHVERWRGEPDIDKEKPKSEPDAQTVDADNSQNASMEVDEDAGLQSILNEVAASREGHAEGADDGDSDDEDDEDPSDVAMVPIADMLNARYGCENAKLFYEPKDLNMITIKAIQKGEQIWNTYGNPPNSDLLRRYGHVDIVNDHGSPADIVEVRADLVVRVASKRSTKLDEAANAERVEWWLEEGGDDVFVLETDLAIPDPLVSFMRLLLSSEDDWTKLRDKGKLPKPRTDKDVLNMVVAVLQERQADYLTTLADDKCLLEPASAVNLSVNKRHAVTVRYGEKRILARTIGRAEGLLQALSGADGANPKPAKRKGAELNREKGHGKRVR